MRLRHSLPDSDSVRPTSKVVHALRLRTGIATVKPIPRLQTLRQFLEVGCRVFDAQEVHGIDFRLGGFQQGFVHLHVYHIQVFPLIVVMVGWGREY